MKVYLCGLKSYQLDLSIECNAFRDARVEQTLQGIKVDHNEPACRYRTPLGRPYLLLMLGRLGSTTYDEIVTRTTFTSASEAS